MPLIVAVAAGLAGLAVGSFLDVVAFRLPRGLSLARPASFCPGCRRTLSWYDNVPVVSWLALRGRCRTCKALIPPRVLLVEAGTAALFCLVAAVVRPVAAVPGCCVLVATGLALAATALDGAPPSPAVAMGGTALGAAALAAAAGVSAGWGHLVGAGVGAGAAGLADLAGTALLSRRQPSPVAEGLVALLPAGTLVGWLGLAPAAGALAGAAVAAVAAAGALAVRTGAPPSAASPAGRGRVAPGRARAAAVAVAVVAMVAGVVVAHRSAPARSALQAGPPPSSQPAGTSAGTR